MEVIYLTIGGGVFMRKVYRGVTLREVKTRKDLNDNLDDVFKKFVKQVCNNYDLDLGSKLTYWLNYWCHNYIPIEKSFNYEEELLQYKRGDVISINLGFNVGSEQGGLHYAVVLNNITNKSNRILTVVPLSTHGKDIKSDEDYSDYEVLINTDIFSNEISRLHNKLATLNAKLTDISTSEDNKKKILKNIKYIQKELSKITSKEKIYAQPAQIKTISKLRIYYPTEVDDILYNVNIGEENLSNIERKIEELFFKKLS